MSLFKMQRYTEDAVFTVRDFEREAEACGPGYGNRRASERRFGDYLPALRHEAAQPAELPCSPYIAGA